MVLVRGDTKDVSRKERWLAYVGRLNVTAVSWSTRHQHTRFAKDLPAPQPWPLEPVAEMARSRMRSKRADQWRLDQSEVSVLGYSNSLARGRSHRHAFAHGPVTSHRERGKTRPLGSEALYQFDIRLSSPYQNVENL